MAPNKLEQVNAIVSEHPELVPVPNDIPGEEGDARKRQLVVIICQEFNRIEQSNNWGMIKKNDRNGFIPADQLAYKPDGSFRDILTDRGAMWGRDEFLSDHSNWEFVDIAAKDPIGHEGSGDSTGVPTTNQVNTEWIINKLDDMMKQSELQYKDLAKRQEDLDVKFDKMAKEATSIGQQIIAAIPDLLKNPLLGLLNR